MKRKRVAARRQKRVSRPMKIGGHPVVVAFTVQVATVEKKPTRIVRMVSAPAARFTDFLSAAQHLHIVIADQMTKTPDLPSEMRLALGKAAIHMGEAFSFLPGAKRVLPGQAYTSPPEKS